MAAVDYEHPPIYSGMLTGGLAASAVGGIGLPIILTVGFVGDHTVPTGLSAVALGALLVGTILLAARSVKKDLYQHRVDHATGTLSVDDVHRIEQRLNEVTTQVGGLRAQVAHADLVADPARFEDTTRRAFHEIYLAIKDAARKRGKDGWTPNDDEWLKDVAEAFDLGKNFRDDQADDQAP